MDESNRRKKSWEMLMSRFSDDLWIEIFLRLPIESLLRFKSVSKSWFSIISSHRFAKSHLALAAKDDKILIVHHELGHDEEDDGSFSLFHLDSCRILENLKFPYSQGEYPFDPTSSELVGSDCGIVCVSVYVNNWRAVNKHFDLYLWNPATRHSKLLPPHTILDDYKSSVTMGFGFDHIDFDFKLVRVVWPTLSAEVYSSNNNTWQKIQSKPIHFPQSNGFHVFHGFLFAIGPNSDMMAFNLNKEVFICGMQLPDSSFDDVSSFDDAESDIQTCIIDFNDTIAVIISNLNEGKINLWTLDNEACVCSGGGKASWTQVLSDVGVSLGSVEGLFNNVHFLLIEEGGDLLLYNWKTKGTTNVPNRPCVESGEFFKYTKSLFSLKGFKRIKWAATSPRLQYSSD